MDTEVLSRYIPKEEPNLLPAVSPTHSDQFESAGEREAIIRMLLQLRQDVDYLKQVVAKSGMSAVPSQVPVIAAPEMPEDMEYRSWQPVDPDQDQEDPEEQILDDEPENLSIEASNLDLISKVLLKHAGNRKAAAEELGISERTLYRKLKKINK